MVSPQGIPRSRPRGMSFLTTHCAGVCCCSNVESGHPGQVHGLGTEGFDHGRVHLDRCRGWHPIQVEGRFWTESDVNRSALTVFPDHRLSPPRRADTSQMTCPFGTSTAPLPVRLPATTLVSSAAIMSRRNLAHNSSRYLPSPCCRISRSFPPTRQHPGSYRVLDGRWHSQQIQLQTRGQLDSERLLHLAFY